MEFSFVLLILNKGEMSMFAYELDCFIESKKLEITRKLQAVFLNLF